MSLIPLILKDAENWGNHMEKFAASSVLCATYGWSLFDSTDRDQTLERITALNRRISHAVVPGNFLVNVFPVLMHLPVWFPGTRWKREGLELNKRVDQLFVELVNDVEIKLNEDGKVEHCLTAKLIENEGKYGLDRKETAWLAGVMFAAGAETTTGTLCTFILAMTLHPDVQRRAHAELDSIVGRDRAPSFEDKQNLPYIDAVVKEVLRWRPAAPIRTTIFENIWAISHNPELFPDPEEFRPSRFLTEQVELSDQIDSEVQAGVDKLFAFGCGRRICPGQHLAYNSLFITISTLLWAFDIGQTTDYNGSPIVPERTAFVDTGLAM
ncbi:hypothetical protein PHLCEN_2v9250 [Hermanssonia centrifuga]|uniref:Cytochrome P450 n=1 Tax=Hermanssonia centrifuga TaxID=98765 RepID=A0A2R6NRE8_9APHY|nr:hypothetical protein PHLCEN_2v9250 [Hermanssonia centrifuga]